MKNIIISLLAIMLFISCDQKIETWSGNDTIYFDMTTDSTIFTFAYKDTKVETDTIYLDIRYMGEVADFPRKFNLKIKETNAVEKQDFEALSDYYFIEELKTFARIPIILKRTEILKEEQKYIVITFEENEFFELHYPNEQTYQGSDKYTDKIMHKILFNDLMLEPPISWNEYYFGKFSPEKFVIICDVMDLPREKFLDRVYMSTSRCSFIATYMKQYFIDMQNAGTPVCEKDGTWMKMGDNI